MSKSSDMPPCTCHQCPCDPTSDTFEQHTQMKWFARLLDEKQRRLFAGMEANRRGRGGQRQVAEILELTARTVRRGQREVEHGENIPSIRRGGAGRPLVEKKRPAS